MNRIKYLGLCAAVASGLGIFGAALVMTDSGMALAQGSPDGAKLYATHCGGCHPNGGNVINQALPIVGSPHMKTLDAFSKFNRQPVKADGSKGIMPAFPKEKISDRDMKSIYEYSKSLPPLKK